MQNKGISDINRTFEELKLGSNRKQPFEHQDINRTFEELKHTADRFV